MVVWDLARARRRTAAALVGTVVLACPSLAAADDGPPPASDAQSADATQKPKRRRPGYLALEVQGIVINELMPKPFFGGDAMLSVGNDTFHLRAGVRLAGSPAVRVGTAKVANVMEVGQLDVCAGKRVFKHRIRMCLGGQAGVWQHLWSGTESPVKAVTPYVAGTLKGDYHFQITSRWGFMFGVGVSVPAVGPTFRGQDPQGRPTVVIYPGPVGGNLSIGTTIRFI